MKKVLIFGTIITLLFTSACSKEKKEEKEPETNVSEITDSNIIKEQTKHGILFKDASIVVVNGITEFRVTLENTITTVRRIKTLTINFKDSEGILLHTLHSYDLNSMKKGDTQDLTWSISKDLTDVKQIEYEIEL